MANNRRRTRTKRRQPKRNVVLLNLPDDVLLEIFDFFINTDPLYVGLIETWQTLVHVCRQWRSLVLGSPRRLNLRLVCSPEIPTKDRLDVWPAFPLYIWSRKMDFISPTGIKNLFEALEQRDRVCEVHLWPLSDWLSGFLLMMMQEPFPELTALELRSGDKWWPLNPIPNSFLGGSAPRLQSLEFSCILFPGLPKLLSSATHLVDLTLDEIPHSGYISPEAMADIVSISSSLRTVSLHFESPQSFPDRGSQSLPPPKRYIIPALHEFNFTGVTGYLEDFLTRIDTPQLNIMDITFVNEVNFGCTRLVQFINSTPKLRALDEAHLGLTSINFRYRTSDPNAYNLLIHIPNKEPHWQLSSIEQVCNLSLQPLSIVEDLYIKDESFLPDWEKDAIENTLLSQLLLPYTAVKNLYLTEEFAPCIAAALQELVDVRITKMLPSLENIFVEEPESLEPFREMFGQFITARQLSGHPVAILSGKEIPTQW